MAWAHTGESPVALVLFAGLALCLATSPGVAGEETPNRETEASGQYALPTEHTPAGVEVNSASLVENANAWNGRMVTFKGEAVGECMVRGQMAWIHLNDDAYMDKNIEEGARLGGYNSGHAIWLSSQWARQITFFGDFMHEGDIVKVTGVFNSACREHGGDMDIHASSMEVVRTGHPVDHLFNTRRALLAIALLIPAGVLYGIRRLVERRRI